VIGGSGARLPGPVGEVGAIGQGVRVLGPGPGTRWGKARGWIDQARSG
jgi:hypothetical protein